MTPTATVFDPSKHPRAQHGRFAAHPSPSAAQAAAGNYRKGHVNIGGLDVSIENEAGSIRRGTNKAGQSWAVRMPAHYGYIRGTEGADGDHLDVHVGPGADMAERLPVHVIDQVHPHNGEFDEHKALIGFPAAVDALGAYDAAYADGSGPKRRAAMTTMTFPAFKQWAMKGDTKSPLAPSLRAKLSDPLTPPGLAPVDYDKKLTALAARRDGSDGHAPSFSQKPLTETGIPRRSATRGESWQRTARLYAPHADEIPLEYTGSRDLERPVGSFVHHNWMQNIPKKGDPAAHEALVRGLAQHIQGEKMATIVRAQEQKLIPEGTPGSTVRRAYNHAAMLGLHDFGVGVYDFKMDDHLKSEMTPLIPFMRYARRRINNVLTGREKGAWRPYRAEFGQRFPTPKFDRTTGEERLRVPPRQELVKLADVYGLPGLNKAATPAQQAKIKQVMREWKGGKLRSWRGKTASGKARRGPRVISHKQAIAIALSQAGRANT